MFEGIKTILLGAEYSGTNRKPQLSNENAGVRIISNKIEIAVINLSR
jgi:hypothetical protein